jgi:hypothetical protein
MTMTKLNAANRLVSLGTDTPAMQAAHAGAQAALAGQPQSTNPHTGKNKPKLWNAWNKGWLNAVVTHGLEIDED